MLTEDQANRVWERMIEAEVRSYYFGELAARYSKWKQIITGVSFYLIEKWSQFVRDRYQSAAAA